MDRLRVAPLTLKQELFHLFRKRRPMDSSDQQDARMHQLLQRCLQRRLSPYQDEHTRCVGETAPTGLARFRLLTDGQRQENRKPSKQFP